MPVVKTVPAVLKAYVQHGMDLSWEGQDQSEAECPFCGKLKWRVATASGLWDCKVCGRAGNQVTFLRELWAAAQPPTDLEELAEDRKLLSVDTLVKWGAIRHPLTLDYALPGYNREGNLVQLYRYVRDYTSKRMKLLPTTLSGGEHVGHGLHGVPLFDASKEMCYVCYSDDTEILTNRGWMLFKELGEEDRVASYKPENESIRFERPRAKQVLDFHGEMVNFASRWCDLLVTPDHRMLCKRQQATKSQVRKAQDVGAGFQLPVSGTMVGEEAGPSETQAKLLTAFVADGCIRGGFQIEFSFYKDRKKERLKSLLNELGIKFKTHHWGSVDESESILIDKRQPEAQFLLECCPKKIWTGKELAWPLKTRQTIIEEIPHWDGDKGQNCIRYFTSNAANADVISRMAVISGYSSGTNRIPSEEENCNDQYVLCMIKKPWRVIVNKPTREHYKGKVYCVTVSTGFVVVRRNGKAVVSGNCEGPWDGMAWWETLQAARSAGLGQRANVLAVPGCSVFNPSWASLLAGKTVVLLFDNDHPREHQGRVTKAGLDGMERVARLLASQEAPPKEIRYIRWGADGYDPELPSGYDVRDWLTQGSTAEERIELQERLNDRIEPVPAEWLVKSEAGPHRDLLTTQPCDNWRDCVQAWRKAMKWTDGLDYGFSIIMAAVASVKVVGDQIWIMAVSPPSTGKSILCEAISVAREYVKAQSTFRGFYSGYQTDKEGTEDLGLVNKLRDKAFVVKDGDTVLTLPNRDQVLGQARDLYDTVGRSAFNNKMSRDYEGIRFAWILCGTGALRALDTSELGERFLCCRIMDVIDDSLEDEISWRKINQVRMNLYEVDGKVETTDTPEMIAAKRITGGYVEWLRQNVGRLLPHITMTDEAARLCMAYAKFVAYLRARPSKKQDEETSREMSARLTSQIGKLAYCLAIVLNRTAIDGEVMVRVRRVAMDTARGRTYEIIRHLAAAGDMGLEVAALIHLTHEGEDKERGLLKFLKRIGACEPHQPLKNGVNLRTRWRLTRRMAGLYREVMGEG
jgi:hypothetical protein